VENATRGAETIVVHAGHFLLFSDDETGRLLPCIASELKEPRHSGYRSRYGMFPELTWRLGLRMLSKLPLRDKRIMIVVNDWQYVSPNADRAEFYSEHQELPRGYAEELAKFSDISLLAPRLRDGREQAFFSEVTLRNHFRKKVRRLIKAGTLPEDATVLRSGDLITCQLPDPAGQMREVYCSERAADCSGEIAAMLDETAAATGCQAYINLYPRVCREFVEYGTGLSERLFSTGIRTCLNVGLNSVDVRDEASLLAGSECVLHSR
jgi:hypothetical protein